MMVASVVLPLVLFGFAAWLSYRHEQAVADDRIERSLDILHEHTLKVFQTVERAIAEVNEIVRGMTDDAIRADQPRLHERMKRIVDALPQLRAIFLIDREGRPLASSQLVQVPADLRSRERGFFNVHTAGTFDTLSDTGETPSIYTTLGSILVNLARNSCDDFYLFKFSQTLNTTTVKKNGTPVWYLVAKDEGHGFVKKKNTDFLLCATVLFVKEFLLDG